MPIEIQHCEHPHYTASCSQWEKYRDVYESGENFINKYLKKFSARESDPDFQARKSITYCPAHAKAAINDIKNAIYQRMFDITRVSDSKTYSDAVLGREGGVDRKGSTMNNFIGQQILPELIVVERVGAYVDRPRVPQNATKADVKNLKPYVYKYKAEDIRSWSFGPDDKLQSLLLRDHNYVYDEETLLPTGEVCTFRLYKRVNGHVELTTYEETVVNNVSKYSVKDVTILNIPEIPFVLFEITQSLLTDVADYQIALLNLASSDMNYSLKSNFPFYTEQYIPSVDIEAYMRNASGADPSADGQAANTDTSGKKIEIGATQGRRYPKGLERPGFINPSPEPLIASMKKQEKLESEIRLLIGLSLTNVEPRRSSAESKQQDQRTKEEGLSNIGLELERGENEIARFWAMYEGTTAPTVSYPKNYSLKTELERREEAKELAEISKSIPSITYQREMAKQIVNLTVGSKITNASVMKIHQEIDSSAVVVTDPETIRSDHEAGFIGTELASRLRGYPEGEAEKAKKDHTERLARIAAAQASGEARGVADQGNPDDGKIEKLQSRQTDTQDTTEPRVRGEGK